MKRVGIVGAGAGAAAAAYEISTTLENASITVLEKSRGLCGRAATRRRDGVVYDYGANYVKSDDDRVTSLLTETLDTDGLVEIREPVWTFDADGSVSSGRDTDERKWTYRSGLTQIAKRLFARTNADVQRETRVETLVRDVDDGTWTLEDTDGRSWGPFDVILLNPPAPQTAQLLRSADWNPQTVVHESLISAVDAVPYRTIWTGVFHYPFELDRPYYALVNTDKEHEIGWIGREECKPGHVPAGESLLIVQANHEWSVEHYDDPPSEPLSELAELTAGVLDDERLTEPDWTDQQGWRYALPDGGVSSELLHQAEDEGLYCLGDWVAGEGRVHATLRNGLDVGKRVSAGNGA
ncbi:NAD(P)/FAD-dependent oxidoreductase [Natrialbaceae archaeon A-arb3/5]